MQFLCQIHSFQITLIIDHIKRHDLDLGPVGDWLQSGRRPPSSLVETASPATRHFWCHWENLSLQEGVLYRKFPRKDSVQEYFQLVVPKCLKDEILRHMHCDILSGHLGRKKTKERLLQRYYWFGVREDINNFIARCDICGAIKLPNKTIRAPLGSMQVGAPMDRLATDIMGPLPETPRGEPIYIYWLLQIIFQNGSRYFQFLTKQLSQ